MAQHRGRPVAERVPLAGKKIQKALELWGKSLGVKQASASHFARWDRWESHGLPKSANTVRADIHLGVPHGRLRRYADCFNIPAELLLDDAIEPHDRAFIDAVLAGGEQAKTASAPTFPLCVHPTFCDLFAQSNTPEHLDALLQILRGAYDMYWWNDNHPDRIVVISFAVETAGEHWLKGRSGYVYHGAPCRNDVYLFKWLKHLHILAYAESHHTVVHMMAMDPARYPQMSARNPFYFHGLTLSEDEDVGIAPVASHVLFKKIPSSEQDPAEAFETMTRALAETSVIHAGDPRFEQLKTRILAPELDVVGMPDTPPATG